MEIGPPLKSPLKSSLMLPIPNPALQRKQCVCVKIKNGIKVAD